MTLTFGSLFAGIGGFDLGFERAGMTCNWQVEIDDYASKVLRKHWPDVRRHGDVRTFPPEPAADWSVDVICGGFPCQDISFAGKGAGLAGERSGLWSEFARIVRVLRPRYVVVENVAALLGRGLGTVLGDLAESGYDAEWDCIPASAVGAPHRRDRIWIVAHATELYGNGCDDHAGRHSESAHEVPESGNGRRDAPMADAPRIFQRRQEQRSIGERIGESGERIALSHAESIGREKGDEDARGGSARGCEEPRAGLGFSRWWEFEPNVGRVAHGIPSRVDRLKGLGNAVVPQIAEFIGRRLMDSHYA